MKKFLFSIVLFVFALEVMGQNKVSSLVPVRSWALYDFYEAANEKVNGNVDVVFMGNSITHGWRAVREDFFLKNKFEGRGIGGQTTYQMLARFQSDVVNLSPRCVVILAGTNDIAQNSGFISTKHIAQNIKSMCEIALFNGIEPVICSVLPVYMYNWNEKLGDVSEIVIELNAILKDYADRAGFTYVDFHSKMVDERGGLPGKYSKDGVHVLPVGYALMEEVLLPVLKSKIEEMDVEPVFVNCEI